MLYGNNKDADQCSLISVFVVRCLDRIMPLLDISKISRLLLASEAEQASLGHTWSQTLKTGFLVMWLTFEFGSQVQNTACVEILYEPLLYLHAQNLSKSPFHQTDMTEILLKRSHPSL